MSSFESLLPSKKSKKRIKQSFSSVLFEKCYLAGIRPTKENYSYFEDICVNYLLNFNERSKKYNSDLVHLWGLLEMKKQLDFELNTTINPYCDTTSEDIYFPEEAKLLTLLDIKHVKKITIEKIKFKDIYFATFEINDNKEDKYFRPYVEVYSKKDNYFKKIGSGYDTNDNKTVELSIAPSFNYPIFLTSKGYIKIPLTGKSKKIQINDILSQDSILKILSNFDMSEIEIKK